MSSEGLFLLFLLVFFGVSTAGAFCQDGVHSEGRLLADGVGELPCVGGTVPSMHLKPSVEFSGSTVNSVGVYAMLSQAGGYVEELRHPFLGSCLQINQFYAGDFGYCEPGRPLQSSKELNAYSTQGVQFDQSSEPFSLAAIPGSFVAMIFGAFGLLVVARRGSLVKSSVADGFASSHGKEG